MNSSVVEYLKWCRLWASWWFLFWEGAVASAEKLRVPVVRPRPSYLRRIK